MNVPEFQNKEHPDILVLFDVDGTLTPARLTISPEMKECLKKLREKVCIGFVGGSDLAKQLEQLGPDAVEEFDYAFSENGLTAYRLGKALPPNSFIQWLGEEKYNKLAKFMLKYLSELDLPVRRGTFIEFRKGMVNVSPIGRNASTEERNAYEKYDLEHHIREKFVDALRKEFPDFGLTYSIGGQISLTSSQLVGIRPTACATSRMTASRRFTSSVTRPSRAVTTGRFTLTREPLVTPSRTQLTPSEF